MLGEVAITDNFMPTRTTVTQPGHVASLIAQGFEQLIVASPGCVDAAMVGLLRERSIELCAEEDATFSSALLTIFGLPQDSEPEETQEAGVVREKSTGTILGCRS